MTAQNTARITQPAWTTVARNNKRLVRTPMKRIESAATQRIASQFARQGKERKYPYSSNTGETWADDVERAEENGWVSGWPLSTQAKRKVSHSNWVAAAKFNVN